MKRTHLGVSLTCLTMTLGASAFAADLAPAGPSAPGFQPTPGVITMMTLGSGGLLMPLLSDDVFASQQARIGDSRTTDGYAKSLPAGVPQPKYRDLKTTAVGTLGVMKEIPASTGAAFLRLAGSGAWTSGSINTPLDTSVPNDRFIAQAFYAPNPSQMFGVGVVYDHIAAKTKETSDPFGSYLMQVRSSFGYQLFYAQQFSPFWGIAAKSEIWRGSTTVNIHQFIGPGVPLLISQQQGDDRVYGELNLVGTFSKQNAPWMIDGIVAHPSVGATFERSFEQTVRNSMGATVTGNAGPVENYGLIMANLRLER